MKCPPSRTSSLPIFLPILFPPSLSSVPYDISCLEFLILLGCVVQELMLNCPFSLTCSFLIIPLLPSLGWFPGPRPLPPPPAPAPTLKTSATSTTVSQGDPSKGPPAKWARQVRVQLQPQGPLEEQSSLDWCRVSALEITKGAGVAPYMEIALGGGLFCSHCLRVLLGVCGGEKLVFGCRPL